MRAHAKSHLAVAVSMALVALGCSGEPTAEQAASGAAAEAESGAAAETQEKAPDPAPEWTLELLGGGSVSLASLRGKTVVIDFWATWCPPCEFQVPELNAFYNAHDGESDVAVFGISVDLEGPDVIQEWVDEKEVAYPILLGDEDLARRYGALGFPTLIIVNPDGNVESRHVGLIETADLEAALTREREAG